MVVKGAKNLKSGYLDTIDPYVKLVYNGKEERTKVLDDNENPNWNEEILFDLDPSVKQIGLSLWDSNVM